MARAVQKSEAENHIPLKHVDFLVLLVLMDNDLHGYGIVKEIGDRTDGQIRLEPGNLYRYIRRLEQDGLVAESAVRPVGEEDDERRRYYTVTALGREVLELEVARLRALIEDFDSTGLVPKGDAGR
ncbi:MAG: PadR family transcriptional regulator [Acidobacteriota bacterium]